MLDHTFRLRDRSQAVTYSRSSYVKWNEMNVACNVTIWLSLQQTPTVVDSNDILIFELHRYENLQPVNRCIVALYCNVSDLYIVVCSMIDVQNPCSPSRALLADYFRIHSFTINFSYTIIFCSGVEYLLFFVKIGY